MINKKLNSNFNQSLDPNEYHSSNKNNRNNEKNINSLTNNDTNTSSSNSNSKKYYKPPNIDNLLKLENNSFDIIGLEQYLHDIEQHLYIVTYLSLNCNHFTDDELAKIVEINLPNINTLEIVWNNDNKNLSHILSYVGSQWNTIQSLYIRKIGGNGIIKNCIRLVGDIISSSPSLKHIMLCGNDTRGVKQVKISFDQYNNESQYVLEDITIKFCEISSDIINQLCFNTIKELDLSYNKIDHNLISIDTQEFVELTSLNLKNTNISRIVFKQLAKLKNLKNLILSNNEMRDYNVKYLIGPYGLESLDISYNNLTSIALTSIAKFIRLKSLILKVNQFGVFYEDEEGKVQDYYDTFKQFLQLEMLESLNMDYNNIKSNMLEFLVELKNLKTLSLRHNSIDDDAIEYFTHLNQLKELKIGANDFQYHRFDFLHKLQNIIYLELGLLRSIESIAHLQKIFEDENVMPNLKNLKFKIDINFPNLPKLPEFFTREAFITYQLKSLQQKEENQNQSDESIFNLLCAIKNTKRALYVKSTIYKTSDATLNQLKEENQDLFLKEKNRLNELDNKFKEIGDNSWLQRFDITYYSGSINKRESSNSLIRESNRWPEVRLYNKLLKKIDKIAKSCQDKNNNNQYQDIDGNPYYYDVYKIVTNDKNISELNGSSYIYRDSYSYYNNKIDAKFSPSMNLLWLHNAFGMSGILKNQKEKPVVLKKNLSMMVAKYLDPIEMMVKRISHYGINKNDQDIYNLQTRWYTQEDIMILLRHYLPDQERYAISARAWVGGNDNIESIDDNLSSALSRAVYGAIVLMPVLVANNHWVGVLIRQLPNNGRIQVLYIDSLGISYQERSGLNEFVAALSYLQNAGIDFSFIDLSQRQQTNNYDCGRFVVHNLVNMANEIMEANTNPNHPLNDEDYNIVRTYSRSVLLNMNDGNIPQEISLEYARIIRERFISNNNNSNTHEGNSSNFNKNNNKYKIISNNIKNILNEDIDINDQRELAKYINHILYSHKESYATNDNISNDYNDINNDNYTNSSQNTNNQNMDNDVNAMNNDTYSINELGSYDDKMDNHNYL